MSEQEVAQVTRARVEIYTRQSCSYCLAEKRLLRQKGVEFVEYAIDRDEEARAKMAARVYERRTVPQIFINVRHIGGYSVLAYLWGAGRRGGRRAGAGGGGRGGRARE